MFWIPCFGPRVFEVFLLLETTFAPNISVFWVGGASTSKNQQPQSLCWVRCAGILFAVMTWNRHSSHSFQLLFCFSTVIGECHLGGLKFRFGQVEGAFVSLRFGTVKKFIFHSGRTNIAGLGKSGPFWRCIFYWTRGKYWISIASLSSARVALGGIIVMAWAACWTMTIHQKARWLWLWL